MSDTPQAKQVRTIEVVCHFKV